nr:MAG TPA: hypothetical protein [Caudoviricetes sp.]
MKITPLISGNWYKLCVKCFESLKPTKLKQ